MPQSAESHRSNRSGRAAGRPAAFVVLGTLVIGMLVWGAFGPGVAGGRPAIRVEDDGQIAGVPFTIHGSGFGAGENVILTVVHADGASEPGMGHESWTVIAQDGTFATTWGIAAADTGSDRFLVRAVGGLSGPTNTAPFGRMAFVNTDLFDYQPGDFAAIVGGGFRAGESVRLQVIHTRGGSGHGEGHDPWFVTADAGGNIATTWYVDPDDSLGAEFLLHAHGSQSGLAAAWAFMDAVCANPPPPDPIVLDELSGVGCPANLNSCTANDVVTTVTSAAPVDGDLCSGPDDTVTLDVTVQFATTANQRYDLGFFIATDGLTIQDQTAQQCAGSAPHPGDGNGNADPIDCDSDLFLDLDATGHKTGDPDTCGDLQNAAGPVVVSFRMTVACNRLDDERNLLVSSCRVWEQNANHESACTNLAQAGTGSKCDCTDLSFAGLLDPCVTGFCDDDNACTADRCDSSSGDAVCHNDPVDDGEPCDDGNVCTTADTCQGGTCTAGTPPDCDDGNLCTDDICDPVSGCAHQNNNAPCGNGVFCDGDEVCTGGTCSSPGDTCPALGKVCDENDDACVDCLDDSHCGGDTPVCNTVSETCTQCTSDAHCTDPDRPVCTAIGGGTCVRCVSDGDCNDGNVCNGGETCAGNTCVGGALLDCDDGNPCTSDSCDPGAGCQHPDAGDALEGSCEAVTDSALCPFPGDTFRIISLQNPTVGASGSVVQNNFMINATNPGQTYYNVFYSGTPGSAFDLKIDIPWPYVTHGANAIQVHDSVGPDGVTLGDGRCFAPGASLPGYTITTDGGSLSAAGNPIILIGDHSPRNLGGTTAVHVSGDVPSTGLAYITIHLDYGLKRTTGWKQAADLTTLEGPDLNLDGTLDGFGDGVVSIKGGSPGSVNGQDYTFSVSYGPTLSTTVYSVNAFKKNPGINGLTLNASEAPKAGVFVQLWGPTGRMIAAAKTDKDGFYSFAYKHTGKPVTFTARLPEYGLQRSTTLKANGYALIVFEGLP